MAMNDPIPGFVWGITKVNSDPDGNGRIKVLIPGLIEPYTHYWIMPMGWPSGPDQQPRPPDIDEKVGVIFLFGDWRHPEAQAIYFRGYAGLASDGQSAGPTVNSEADDPRDVNCIYEDDTFQLYLKCSGDTPGDAGYERKLVMQTKERGSKVEINAADGADAKSEVIYIEGDTAVSIYSTGQVDIDGSVITIAGRRVSPQGGEI